MAETPRPLSLLLIIVLSLVVVGGALDVWSDGPDRWWTLHVALELTLIALSTGCLVYFWRAWRASALETMMIRSALTQSERTLAERQRERDQWRASAEQSLAGLGRAIDAQFTAWSLTPTEREVALQLLRGVGHKQIAGHSGRSERTVRQHAVAVYGKAGVSGRAELAAFFLQDLTLPTMTVEGRSPS
ncbi:MAG: LuxR family transcriptional regulator [Gemmatimonadaceae bacterium]|nr:LuxR family transcriptional regulator [Gemmatimonadaceae bacterium]